MSPLKMLLWLALALGMTACLYVGFLLGQQRPLGQRRPTPPLTPEPAWKPEKASVALTHIPATLTEIAPRAAGGGVAAASADDGMEFDPRMGMRVPRFWDGQGGAEREKQDGRPTILLTISAYRDFQCPETLASALSRATHPGRVSVAVVQQNLPGDTDCALPPRPCAEDGSQEACTHQERIWVYSMSAKNATGPVYARHVTHRMYRGQAFVLQIDAHCSFVQGWDEDIQLQWRQARNEMAVLSTYLTDVQGSITADGRSLRSTRPIMCNSAYEWSAGMGGFKYLRHGSQPEEPPRLHGQPMLQPFWAAGMSFAPGHFVRAVPCVAASLEPAAAAPRIRSRARCTRSVLLSTSLCAGTTAACRWSSRARRSASACAAGRTGTTSTRPSGRCSSTSTRASPSGAAGRGRCAQHT
jgi:hypothetical protein